MKNWDWISTVDMTYFQFLSFLVWLGGRACLARGNKGGGSEIEWNRVQILTKKGLESAGSS